MPTTAPARPTSATPPRRPRWPPAPTLGSVSGAERWRPHFLDEPFGQQLRWIQGPAAAATAGRHFRSDLRRSPPARPALSTPARPPTRSTRIRSSPPMPVEFSCRPRPATIVTYPAAPTNFTAAAHHVVQQSSLTWTPDANGADHYDIEPQPRRHELFVDRFHGQRIGFQLHRQLGGCRRHVQVSTHRDQLDGKRGGGELVASVSTLTAAPSGLATTSITANSVSLQWNNVQGETGFVDPAFAG